MSALIHDELNEWHAPDFDVTVDDDGYITIDSPCLLLKPEDARDLMQALAQAIAAAELMQVASGDTYVSTEI